MRVFLTGATGFIGQALTGALRQRGWQVTALVRKPESAEAKAVAALGATLAPGDITDVESMRGPMAGADIVIHNAAWYELGIGGKEADRQMQAVNVDGARNTLALARELGVPRIVYVSSIVALGVTGDDMFDERSTRKVAPLNPYERTKAEAHQIALDLIAQGAPVMIAMPGAVVGPGDHANLGILQRLYVRGLAPPLVIGGDHYRSYVYVDDVAEGIALIAELGRIGEDYLLSGENLTYREIAELWATSPGGMKPLMAMPKFVAPLSGAFFETAQRWLRLPNLLSVDAAHAAYSHYRYSDAKARRELGWQRGDIRQQWLETLAEERRRAGKAQ